LTEHYKLTEEEKKELLPSGVAFLFENRAHWARFYLKKAGLVDSFKRGTIIISERGINLLKSNPPLINLSVLKQFPEFNEINAPKNEKINPPKDSAFEENIDTTEVNTPEETLENAYIKIRKVLAQEKLVVELLVKMGYGGSLKDAGKAVGKSGDEGIDGTIKEDKLGLDIIYIQAKRWQPGNVVGRPELHKFVGALAGQGAKKGIFITTSSFTKDAIEYIPRNETKIVLIDGELLSQYMIDYNIGVSFQQTYEVKRLDNDYFGEE
jgi:restriction system protein